MTEVRLTGCRAEPLASYLKAVGVLRLIADQLDPAIRGRWARDSFVLSGDVDGKRLLEFFTARWQPTPLVSPWNGGSGFKQEKNPSAAKALSWVASSTDPRLAPYRDAIVVGKRIYAAASAAQWPKRRIVEECRNWLPDEALVWLDATVVLTNDDEVYPPLLGTGGNDGRFDFTVAYMARLADVLGTAAQARSRAWLASALYDDAPTPLLAEAVGQFDPGSAGGVNAASTGKAEGLVNPWDWLLCLEGALCFAGVSARRLGASSRGRAAIPFTLAPSSVGYATGAPDEQSRGELWTPLWANFASAGEVLRVLGEGRIEWQGAQAGSGLDGARALATLGVDRGIDAFVRHALVSRNGLATLAVPVGRIAVRPRPQVQPTETLDGWLGALRRESRRPAGVAGAMRRLDDAVFRLAVEGGRPLLHEVLTRAGELDEAVAGSPSYRERTRVAPLLRPYRDGWVTEDDAGTPEFRLAAGFASLRDRVRKGQRWGDRATLGRLLRPVRYDARSDRLEWSEAADVPGLGVRPLLDVLADAHVRRGVLSLHTATGEGDELDVTGIQPGYDDGQVVPLADIAALLAHEVDVATVERLLIGLLRLDWTGSKQLSPRVDLPDELPPALTLLMPFYLSRGRTLTRPSAGDPAAVPSDLRAQPDWLSRLRGNAVAGVLQEAALRLRLAGVNLAVGSNPRLRAAQLSALAKAVDGRALAAVLLLRISIGDVASSLSRLSPELPSTSTSEETA